MWRDADIRRFEQRGAKRLVRALSALLFAISILAQLATPAGAAGSHGGHWLCAKPIANASANVHPDSADGRTAPALDHCDHCAIGQAPTLPAATADGHTEHCVEPCATLHSNWTDPGGREPTNPSLARAPPAFS